MRTLLVVLMFAATAPPAFAGEPEVVSCFDGGPFQFKVSEPSVGIFHIVRKIEVDHEAEFGDLQITVENGVVKIVQPTHVPQPQIFRTTCYRTEVSVPVPDVYREYEIQWWNNFDNCCGLWGVSIHGVFSVAIPALDSAFKIMLTFVLAVVGIRLVKNT
jgi:hypothetical protein